MAETLKDSIIRLLRWSEKYTKTDMVYLAKGGGWTGFGVLVSGVLSFATAVAFANLLPKQTYGAYQYVLSTVALIGILGLPGMKTAVSYASARGHDKALFAIMRLKLTWGFVVGAVVGACSIYYFWNGNTMLGTSFLVAAMLTPFWEVPAMYVPYLQGKKRFDIMNLYENSIQALTTVIMVSLLWVTDILPLLLLGYFGSLVAGRYYFYYKTIKQEPPQGDSDPSVISYGWHLSFMNAAGTISSNIDKFLLWHLINPVALATYTFALAIPQRGMSVTRMVGGLAFPKMAAQDFGSMQKTLLYKVLLNCIVGAVIAGVYIVAAPFIFGLFFPQYMEAVIYSQLAAVLIALEPFTLYATSLLAHAKTRSLYIYNLSTPAVRALLFIGLIPPFGILGAIFALIGTELATIGILLFLFYREESSIPA